LSRFPIVEGIVPLSLLPKRNLSLEKEEERIRSAQNNVQRGQEEERESPRDLTDPED
jgi:hypothetical protein